MDLPFELDTEFLKSLLNDFDLMTLLPDLADVMTWLVTAVEYALVIGPMLLVALGLLYLLLPTKEANHFVGYRFFWGMGSIKSWRFTQRFAGAVWTVLGLVLVLEANDFRAQIAGMENLELMYQSIELLLKQVYYVVVSCLAVNVVVFLIFRFTGEIRWVWRKLGELIAKGVGILMANIRQGKTDKPEKRPRRTPGQNAKPQNDPQSNPEIQ